MIGQVDDRISIADSAILDAHLVIRQAIIDKGLEVSRITFLAIPAEARQVQNVIAFLCGPNAFVEAIETTVKMVRAVVFWKLIHDAIHSESTLRDAIRVTSNQSAEVAWIADVIFERPKAEYDVAEKAIAIRRPQRRDGATVGDDGHLISAIVRESVRKDLGAHRCAKVCFVDRHSLLKTRFASSRVSIEPTSNQRPGTFQT